MKAKDLKNSILQMAVQGKLVPQDPTDEPASVLLERIREQRRQLIAEGKIKAPKGGESVIYRASDGKHYEKRIDAKGRESEPVCIDDEIPFEIPESWEWCRLESIAAILNGDRGKNYPAKSKLCNKGIPFVSAININNGIVVDDQMLYMNDVQFQLLRAGKLRYKDIVFCIRGSLGKYGMFLFEKGAIASSLVIVRPHLDDDVIRDYILNLFESPLTSEAIKSTDNGTAQPNLAAKSFERFLYPIPPIDEQSRINEKISSLADSISRYDALERAREKLDTELPDRLRKSILQMAVQGKLVPQDPTDEPASVLLDRIREQRRQLIAEGKIKAPKGGESVIYRASDGGYYEKRIDTKGRESETACIEDEIPFEIPNSWEWVRLGSIATFGGGGTPDKSNKTYWNGKIPWASMKDIHGDFLNKTEDAITDEGLKSKPSISVCEPGQLIVSTRLVPGKTILSKIRCAINQDLKVVITEFPVGYLQLWFNSNLDLFKQLGMGTTVPGIKLHDLEDALIPIPPEVEQSRILNTYEKVKLLY